MVFVVLKVLGAPCLTKKLFEFSFYSITNNMLKKAVMYREGLQCAQKSSIVHTESLMCTHKIYL